MGHRRLAIIDVAGGAQPLANEDDTCWIVFNGEVYNHRTLRPQLEAAGHRFRTSSDTETIVHAWEEYGPACVERLEGMFAFAILDERRRELFIARDRLGKKPLYYAVLDGVLHFASELPALAASPSWKGDLDLSGLEGYLSLGYLLAPSTPFAGVFKLPPAHTLHVKDGRLTTRRYWDVTEFDSDRRAASTVVLDAVDETLGAAVTDRLESEVPLGAFLSGGIDSGLVVSYMAEALGDRLVTTTVGFAEAAHNELAAARLTAAHVKARHHEHLIEPSLDEVLDPATIGCGEPMADSSAIPTWYVSRAARSHVTVALSGDGGDETFAGYDFRYVPHVLESQARRMLPGSAGRRLARWTGRAWPRGPHVPRALRAGTLLDNLSRDAASAFYVDLCFLKPASTRALMGLRPGRRARQRRVRDGHRCLPPVPVELAADARAVHGPARLHAERPARESGPHEHEARAGGAESLSRSSRRRAGFQICRPAFVNAAGPASGSCASWRSGGCRPHWPPCRNAGSRRRSAPGSPGPTPAATRTRCSGRPRAPAPLIDRSVLRTWFDEHRAGRADHSYVLWAAWVLERWLRTVGTTRRRRATDVVATHAMQDRLSPWPSAARLAACCVSG